MEAAHLRVLIVEDLRDYARLIERALLNARGDRIDVRSVASLGVAIQVAQENDWDVVILDLGLPDSKGVDTVRRFHAALPNLPIVVLSAIEDRTTIYDAVHGGAQEYLAKEPGIENHLVRSIHYAIDRKKAEQALAAEKRLLTTLLDTSPDSIYFKDAEGRFTLVNRAMAARLGSSDPRRLIGQTAFDVFARECAEAAQAAEEDILSSGRISECEEKLLWLGGGETWVSSIRVPLRDENGRVIGLFGIARDVTERRHAEEALRKSKETFQDLVENLNDVVYNVDSRGILTYVSPAARRVFGWSVTDVVGKPFTEFVAQEDLPASESCFAEACQKGDARVECRVLTPAGTPRWAYASVRAIREGDTVVGLRGVITDVSERHRTQEALLESREQLRALAARVESACEAERIRISREIHDELGHSLSTAKIHLHTVRRRVPESVATPARDYFDRKLGSAMALIDDTVQAIRRIATELRPQILDHLGLLAAMEWQARQFEEHTKVRTALRVPEGDVPFDADQRTALYRVLEELLTNVARHAQATEVRIRLEQEAADWVLEVADNGRGIAPEEIGKTSSLGLIGVHERVKLLNGTLVVRGEAARGTTVTVRVPRRTVSPRER